MLTNEWRNLWLVCIVTEAAGKNVEQFLCIIEDESEKFCATENSGET